jgi:hypothetical protein
MRLSIRTKLVLAILVIMAISAVASASMVRILYGRSAQAAAADALRGADAAYKELERQDVARQAAIVDMLAANQALRDAFAARDRERLQALSLPIHQVLKKEHGIEHWNYVDSDTKRMFLRVHLPDKHSDVIERPTILKAMERRELSAGKELGKSAFALRVGKPVILDGRLVGYIELGHVIDSFLGLMKTQTGDDVAMFINKKLIDASEWARTRGTARNNWEDFPSVVVVNSTTQDAIVDASAASLGEARTLAEQSREGAVFARAVFPVKDSTGAIVGGLVVRHDITALYSQMWNGMLQAIAFFAALAVVTSLLAYLLVDRLIFRRLRTMMTTMEDASMRLAGGDYSVAATVKATSRDEIGSFEEFFGNFLGLVGNTLRTLVERSRQRPATTGQAPQQPPPVAGRGGRSA